MSLPAGLFGLLLLGSTALASAPPPGRHFIPEGYLDIEGGGMIDVQGTVAAVGHMSPPFAATLLDVAEPARPRILSRVRARPGTHSHKARICGSTLVINVERYGGGGDGSAGMALYDISDPRQPREAAYYEMGGLSTGGTGMHRFQLDCSRKLVYASGSAEGFQGNVTVIVDVSDAAHPGEVGRWWYPGQNIAGGETPAWPGRSVRTHHPLRMGDRLYVSLWYGGFAILDISDMTSPVMVGHVDYHDARTAPTHTALPVSHRIMGRKWLVVFDEEMGSGESEALVRLFDISDEKHPAEAGVFQIESDSGCRFGPHQPHEHVGPDNLLYAAWFAGGLRVIDISDPYHPREAGRYIPVPADGQECALTNDVFVDQRGLVYLIDRVRGLSILRPGMGDGQGGMPAP